MTQLAQGDKAPQINAPDQDRNPVKLADYKGSKTDYQGCRYKKSHKTDFGRINFLKNLSIEMPFFRL